MKRNHIPVVFFIFFILFSCTSDENSPVISEGEEEEEIVLTRYLTKATLFDDGGTSGPKAFFYDDENRIVKITGSLREIVVTYVDSDVSAVRVDLSNGVSNVYEVSINENTISLSEEGQIIEIDFTDEYVDTLRIINQNPSQLVVESTFTRNSNNNIIEYKTETTNEINTYTYTDHDDKNCTPTYNSFNNDYFLIFGLKPSNNNPLSYEYVYNNTDPSTTEINMLYDDTDNVVVLNQSVIRVEYEYAER